MYNGEVTTMDFDYDGCTDAYVSGFVIGSSSNIEGALLAGDCSGILRATALGLPRLSGGDAVAHDFDRDGFLEYFATGRGSFNQPSVFYYRFQSGGVPENIQSSLPNIVALFHRQLL